MILRAHPRRSIISEGMCGTSETKSLQLLGCCRWDRSGWSGSTRSQGSQFPSSHRTVHSRVLVPFLFIQFSLCFQMNCLKEVSSKWFHLFHDTCWFASLVRMLFRRVLCRKCRSWAVPCCLQALSCLISEYSQQHGKPVVGVFLQEDSKTLKNNSEKQKSLMSSSSPVPSQVLCFVFSFL